MPAKLGFDSPSVYEGRKYLSASATGWRVMRQAEGGCLPNRGVRLNKQGYFSHRR